MRKRKGKTILIAALIVVNIVLITFIVLLVTDTIKINGKDTNRDKVAIKLKEVLNDESWVKNNLYSKKNCFDSEINSDSQKLTFAVLQDNSDNPIVIVFDLSYDDCVKVPYKVYVDNENVKVENVVGYVGHPSHVGFLVDEKQGLVISDYGHMGYYNFKAYDVKGTEIKVVDEYDCNTGDCEYEYKGEKKYNLSDITIELTKENINKYIK